MIKRGRTNEIFLKFIIPPLIVNNNVLNDGAYFASLFFQNRF